MVPEVLVHQYLTHHMWNTGDTTYSIDNLGVGNYDITVTDENNCSSTGNTTINSSSVLTSSIWFYKILHIQLL